MYYVWGRCPVCGHEVYVEQPDDWTEGTPRVVTPHTVGGLAAVMFGLRDESCDGAGRLEGDDHKPTPNYDRYVAHVAECVREAEAVKAAGGTVALWWQPH